MQKVKLKQPSWVGEVLVRFFFFVFSRSLGRYVNHYHGTDGGQFERAPLFLVHDGKVLGIGLDGRKASSSC